MSKTTRPKLVSRQNTVGIVVLCRLFASALLLFFNQIKAKVSSIAKPVDHFYKSSMAVFMLLSFVQLPAQISIGPGYFNGSTFAVYTTPATTGTSTTGPILGNLAGNNFTITFTNTGNLKNYSNNTLGSGAAVYPSYSPGSMPSGNSWPSNTRTIDLNWYGSPMPTNNYAEIVFTNNLNILDHLHIIDVDSGESVLVEFYATASGGTPLTINDNVTVLSLSSISGVPVTYPNATSVAINDGPVANGNVGDQGFGFLMRTDNVKRIRIYQISGGGSDNHTWDFTFSKGAPDRGDALASYGSASHLSLHDLLRLGANGGDGDVAENNSALADGDDNSGSNDEDGVAVIPNVAAVGNTVPTYSITASVRNNSGANARAIAWIDWNNNGLFDVSEAATTTAVPSSTSTVDRTFTWTNAVLGSFSAGQGAFLRIRLSDDSSLTTATPTGFLDGIGEVEDYFIPLSPDLSIAKTINNSTPQVGTNVTFTITATNSGASAATGVTATESIPSGYTVIGVSPSAGTTWAAPTWTIGNLAGGASATLTVVATVNATGNYANTVTVSGNQTDPTPANNTATVTPTICNTGTGQIILNGNILTN
ncbi:MAG: DUF11 domain-containing protein [Flavobacterium sp.]